MGLPVDTMKEIARLGAAAEKPLHFVVNDRDPKNVYHVVKPDGSLEPATAPRGQNTYTAADLETVVRFAVDIAAVELDTGPGQKPRMLVPGSAEIWYSRTGVIAGTDPGNEFADRCVLTLQPSPQLKVLAANESGGGVRFSQKELIRLLRTTLAGCWSGDLLTSVRKLKIDKAKQVQAEQVKGKVSLNRNDVAEMSGAADLPDDVVFDVPVFAAGSITCRAQVRAALDLDPESETFALTVLPGQTEAAYTKGEIWLAAQIGDLLGDKADAIPVYHGQP